ncbi:enhancer of split M2 protein [Teleopsis dalmanni]|uniref:Enhancer of split region protein HLHm2 n=1 Tax=Teleopsis dalmanni TaxID=139649 RepID=G9I1L6_TELDL|nr:enhancer of split M2 protein [Teleopsis dalmanni]AEV91203.1 enhancer of split region protein HLHm2 [Teleopsis dalmanni]
MFTDTKNLSNATLLDSNLFNSSEKSKGKLRRVWKPLLRLMSMKTKTKSSTGTSTKTHPNNINLNNATSVKDIYELSTALLEDYTAMIRKVAPEVEQESIPALPVTDTKHTTTVVSSASIEKTPTPNCTGCIYGRNCQHEQFHQDYLFNWTADVYDVDTRNVAAELVNTTSTTGLPVQYISTDDGTFFWTTSEHRVDDNLLHAWLCQTLKQLPVQTALL